MAPNSNFDTIRAIKVLGKGATGTVFLAHDTSSDPSAHSPFALKVVPKSGDLHRRALRELSFLSGLAQSQAHPFLPSLLGSIESTHLLGWALPFCPGGDLNSLRYLQTDHVFTHSAIKFYLAEILCTLAYLHSMRIAYRDLKPENVLVQSSGHVTLTDFDLSKKLTVLEPIKSEIKQCKPKPKGRTGAKVTPESGRKEGFSGEERSESFVGTAEYVAPEVVRGEAHSFGVDWWALGVMAYEMMYGKTPFRGKNRKETFRNVLMKRPEFWGKRTALMDLIEQLLEKDPTRRLGYYGGAEEIKAHEFFRGLRWELLTEVVRPPFVPGSDDGGGLTEKITAFDVREYFQKMRAPPPSILPSSPPESPPSSSVDDLF